MGSDVVTERVRRLEARRRLRARLRHAAVTRMAMRLSGGRVREGKTLRRVRMVEHVVEVGGLDERLSGLRIAHLSDLHVGELLGLEQLTGIIDATNGLEADLIAVTGDFVDLHHDVLEGVTRELLRLRAAGGVFLVMGNHDYLVDGRKVARALRGAGLEVLINEARRVSVRGSEVVVGGIDYEHRKRELRRLVGEACEGEDGPYLPAEAGAEKDGGAGEHGALRVLLAHHPHAFDAAAAMGVELTLSGHTHGGQVVVATRRGRSGRGSYSLGGLTCRYPHGLYRWGESYLHVTAGVGTWFPWRVRCPAEIGCLTVVVGEKGAGARVMKRARHVAG
ncbi:MAG: metallophosphoesterase [Phycisphaeraceae bacterium]|nr:metallophosphoesterase [Phycisphaeraceae bacterium]